MTSNVNKFEDFSDYANSNLNTRTSSDTRVDPGLDFFGEGWMKNLLKITFFWLIWCIFTIQNMNFLGRVDKLGTLERII